jgi:hypothetical protein
MQSLNELMKSERGLDFLRERGIFVDSAAFVRSLKVPARASLTDLLGVRPDCHLVYVGQQACSDYEQSTVRKFEAARDLGRHNDVVVTMLWHDMYQADAERFGTRILLQGGSKVRGVWLVPRAMGIGEPWLIPVDRVRLQDAMQEFRSWVDNAPCADRPAARARVKLIADDVLSDDVATLGQVTGAIASRLLREQLGFSPPSTSASTMVTQGLMTDALNDFLANIDAVVTVFNAAVENLIALGVDPQVKQISADYLPLHYSCPHDGIRLRLAHERSGSDHFAVATCRCRTQHRFHLGSGAISLGELQSAGRWSPDVSMPVYHNDIASGWVAGRSTALYGLVFNEVLKKVLGREPIPALVPARLSADADQQTSANTLLLDYLNMPLPGTLEVAH